MEEARQESGSTIEASGLLNLNSIEGAPYIQFAWLYKGSEKKPTHPNTLITGERFLAISDTWGRTTIWFYGRGEFWVGGEKHVLTKAAWSGCRRIFPIVR